MLIQVDMKEKFKEILEEILFKMEELSDEEWLLDIHDINKFIFQFKLKEKKELLKNQKYIFKTKKRYFKTK